MHRVILTCNIPILLALFFVSVLLIVFLSVLLVLGFNSLFLNVFKYINDVRMLLTVSGDECAVMQRVVY